MNNSKIKNKIIDSAWVVVTPSGNKATLNTNQGNHFKCTQTSNTTYSISSVSGEAFTLVLTIQTPSTPTFSGATIYGDLATSAGSVNVINFIHTDSGIKGYVLGS